MLWEFINGIAGLLVILAVCIGVFLALREVALWYFRINQIADNIAVIADYCRSLRQPHPEGSRPPPIPPGYVEVAPPPPPRSPQPKFHPLTGKPLP